MYFKKSLIKYTKKEIYNCKYNINIKLYIKDIF